MSAHKLIFNFLIIGVALCISQSDVTSALAMAKVDTDGDGLIEISTIEELNNMRHNLAGTSYKTSSRARGKTTGCPRSGCFGYELNNNLDFSGSRWASGKGWEPIGDEDDSFTATFDGNGYTISGLTIISPATAVGFFGHTRGATIRNITLANASVIGSKLPGSSVGTNEQNGVLVGYASGSNIEKVRIVNAMVYGRARTGGLVGIATEGTTIEQVYVEATVGTSGRKAAVMIGQVGNNVEVKNSYCSGSVDLDNPNKDFPAIGGLTGDSYAGSTFSVTDVYCTGVVRGGSGYDWYYADYGNYQGVHLGVPAITNSYYLSGAAAKTKTSSRTNRGCDDNDYYFYLELDDRIKSTTFDSCATETKKRNSFRTESELKSGTPSDDIFTGWSTDIWNFGGPNEYPVLAFEVGLEGINSGGRDTDGDGLIEIATAAELNNIRYNLSGTSYKTSSSGPGKTSGCPRSGCFGYELTSDIDLAGSSWRPIGGPNNRFAAVFEGNGHTISNLFIANGVSDYQGLFGYTDGATIKNLSVTANITGRNYVGILAGFAYNTIINQVNASGNVRGYHNSIGGLVGLAYDTLINQVNANANVTSYNNSGLGGLVGLAYNTIVNKSYATGNIGGYNSVGRLVGQTYNTIITNNYAISDVLKQAIADGLIGDVE